VGSFSVPVKENCKGYLTFPRSWVLPVVSDYTFHDTN